MKSTHKWVSHWFCRIISTNYYESWFPRSECDFTGCDQLNYGKLSYSKHVFLHSANPPNCLRHAPLASNWAACPPWSKRTWWSRSTCPLRFRRTCSEGWGCWRSSHSLQSEGMAEIKRIVNVFISGRDLKRPIYLTKYEPGLWGQWMWCAGWAAEPLRPTGWDSPENNRLKLSWKSLILPKYFIRGQIRVDPWQGHHVSYLDKPGQLRYICQMVINNIWGVIINWFSGGFNLISNCSTSLPQIISS